jgi:plasmid stabilization system protein ParE
MSYILRWMPRGELTFNKNIEYLEKEWDEKTLKQFLERVGSVLELIQRNPFLYPLYNPAKKIRKCVIHGRVVLYYRVKGNSIEILWFWNTYQNPNKLRL